MSWFVGGAWIVHVLGWQWMSTTAGLFLTRWVLRISRIHNIAMHETLTALGYWHKHENRHAKRRNYCVMCTFGKQEYLHGDSNCKHRFVVNVAYRLLRVNTYRRIRQITTNTCFIFVTLHMSYKPSLRLLILASKGFITEGTTFTYECYCVNRNSE